MAQFKFTDSQARDYVLESGNLHAEPGEVYELDNAPDERFEAVNASVKAPVSSVSVSEVEPDELSTEGA